MLQAVCQPPPPAGSPQPPLALPDLRSAVAWVCGGHTQRKQTRGCVPALFIAGAKCGEPGRRRREGLEQRGWIILPAAAPRDSTSCRGSPAEVCLSRVQPILPMTNVRMVLQGSTSLSAESLLSCSLLQFQPASHITVLGTYR